MKRLLLFPVLLLAQQLHASTTEGIAKQFFPEALKMIVDQPIPLNEQRTVFVTGSLDPSGPVLIVAGYCNGERAGIAVISPAGTPTLLAEVTPESLIGRRIAIRLIDVNGDQRPEIIARVDQYRGLPGTWVYQWSNGRLNLMGPTSEEVPGDVASELSDATFLDLDGDGIMEVIDHEAGASYGENGEATVANEYRVGHVGDATLSTQSLDYFGEFLRNTTTPATTETHFGATNVDQPRELIVINGTGGVKASRVASAIVTLNGSVVVRESDLSINVDRVRVTLPGLAAENTLCVELRGQPGGTVSIVLRPQP